MEQKNIEKVAALFGELKALDSKYVLVNDREIDYETTASDGIVDRRRIFFGERYNGCLWIFWDNGSNGESMRKQTAASIHERNVNGLKYAPVYRAQRKERLDKQAAMIARLKALGYEGKAVGETNIELNVQIGAELNYCAPGQRPVTAWVSIFAYDAERIGFEAFGSSYGGTSRKFVAKSEREFVAFLEHVKGLSRWAEVLQ